MFDLDKWNEIFSTIRKHKLRTALTCFGVFWGIFMLTLMLGASKGLENGVMEDFDIAKNTVFVWTQKTSIPYKGFKAGRYIGMKVDDAEAIRANVDIVDVISPRNSLNGDFTVKYKESTASFSVYGDYPEFTQVEMIHQVKGRFINQYDIEQKRKIVVIGQQAEKILFGDENGIGKYIEIKGVHFKVVGVFRPEGDAEEVMEDAKNIHMPHSTMRQAFNQGDRVYWFAFTPKLGVPAARLETEVKALLRERHYVHPDDIKAFGSFNVERQYQQIQGLFGGISAISWFVSIGTIFAGMVGVSNIMLIIVKERTKEIGVRKALGATPWSIISLIIQESIVITAFAGYTGLLLGTGLVEGINYLLTVTNGHGSYFSHPEVNAMMAITATILLVITGAIAGFIPAAKAAAVNPVVALKDE